MWARLESNTIKEILTRPKALTIGGVQYPSNIFGMWSNSELAVIGIVPVEQDNTNLKDKEYYINTAQSYAYNTETISHIYFHDVLILLNSNVLFS